jgi:hypothetical protein
MNLENGRFPTKIDPYKVSATDVFVEKAQKAITDRAVKYQTWGAIISFVTIASMIAAAVFLWRGLEKFEYSDYTYDLYKFLIIIIRMLTIGALIAGVGYFLISIARALLHEGTALYSRRHALRFGRLYVYLKGGEIQSVDELERAFRWNDAVHTAFVDIKPDKATKSFAQLISEVGIEAIKAGGSAAEAAAGQGKSKAKRRSEV